MPSQKIDHAGLRAERRNGGLALLGSDSDSFKVIARHYDQYFFSLMPIQPLTFILTIRREKIHCHFQFFFRNNLAD